VRSDSVAEDLENAAVGPLDEGMQEQFDAAKQAVYGLITSGAFGNDKTFNVNLSGHANVGHEPQDGWSNDHVTVSVGQRT
jgi:hypothetical protein